MSASLASAKNIPLNEIPTLHSAGKVSQPIFITTHPADQKAGDNDSIKITKAAAALKPVRR
ncbi:hypothetical protein FHX10_004547 [Rhizobium sp. BK591]|uniref:hypothetical protein n=1 Tax=Rhizobium sp. BK591 TaxID=2586985 RepID=UPI0016182974|nr:hypothetical protein [Rhizobium sp. BK591]MBB3745010.1 hypothetical protein [Rhizobium sp. BK591]